MVWREPLASPGIPKTLRRPVIATENNPWRKLARELGLPSSGAVCRIPDIDGKLYDPDRYKADRPQFEAWCKKWFKGPVRHQDELYPEWRFNHQAEPDGRGFTKAGRNSFLCLYSKLKRERLWDEIDTIWFVGTTGEFTFFPARGPLGLRDYLVSQGYGDFWMASYDADWGVRSRFRGPQLHFKGSWNPDEPTWVHIDRNNPGDPATGPASGALRESPAAVHHKFCDDWCRKYTHNWWTIRSTLAVNHILVPSLGDTP